MRLYLSGPMRGVPELNRPVFTRAAADLRARGYLVFNPGEQPDNDIRANLAVDLAWICAHADAVAVLPNWNHSKGACAEVALARALGLLVAPVDAYGPDGPALEALIA